MDPIRAPLAPTATSVMDMTVATKLPAQALEKLKVATLFMETNTHSRGLFLPAGNIHAHFMKPIRRRSTVRDVAANMRLGIHRNLATEDLILSEFTV